MYSVRYDGRLIAFFTLSISQIESKVLNAEDDNLDSVQLNIYSALLLGKIGIDRHFKGKGVASYIFLFCMGIGQLLNEKVGCAFLIFRTTKVLTENIMNLNIILNGKKLIRIRFGCTVNYFSLNLQNKICIAYI